VAASSSNFGTIGLSWKVSHADVVLLNPLALSRFVIIQSHVMFLHMSEGSWTLWGRGEGLEASGIYGIYREALLQHPHSLR